MRSIKTLPSAPRSIWNIYECDDRLQDAWLYTWRKRMGVSKDLWMWNIRDQRLDCLVCCDDRDAFSWPPHAFTNTCLLLLLELCWPPSRFPFTFSQKVSYTKREGGGFGRIGPCFVLRHSSIYNEDCIVFDSMGIWWYFCSETIRCPISISGCALD